MTNPADNRKYRRLSTNWIGKIRQRMTPEAIAEASETRISNISLGGVFIDTSVPFPIGTYIELDFTIPGKPGTIHAEGIVKWSNGEHNANLPVGMGIEFLRVSTPSRSAIVNYVEEATSSEILQHLTKTEAHNNLLKFYCRKIGESFELDILAQFLNCKHNELLAAMKDFIARGLISTSEKKISFLQPPDQTIASVIRNWYQKQS